MAWEEEVRLVSQLLGTFLNEPDALTITPQKKNQQKHAFIFNTFTPSGNASRD